MTETINKELLQFIDASPSCYHAIDRLEQMLNGFTRLYEEEEWNIKRGNGYYVIRKDSSLIAFKVPTQKYNAIRIAASHSDSPTFKLKPLSVMKSEGHYIRLNTEKYGGMNMATWLDRPLSIAGRVVVKEGNKYVTKLVNIDRDLLIIPSVAIHMNRDLNEGYKYAAQVDTIPLFGDADAEDALLKLVSDAAQVAEDRILGQDLFLYNRMKGTQWGANGEFISSRCLDDLQCAFACTKGFLSATNPDDLLSLNCVFDNEEVGSLTSQGADSSFLSDVLERINESLGYDKSDMLRAIANGYMVSADNGHAVHPNHPEYADPTNRPYMNGGVVIKYNAAQHYTTDALSEAMFRTCCAKAKAPVQTYTNKSNVAGGSTLGNLSNRHISIRTVDVGLAQLSMHSSFETAGADDTEYLMNAIQEFFGE